ncbi:hypothetical protein PsYK624_116020 [Phanerochaete sordida]|uniref:DUF6535 domain-containing protein n=1 Tax=Phanerochaete sordida TaxID=48140 RepID=A0A9P3GG70_9APHY|nr:hypothetical protein PsYK624_116020 [Phanerochaete sordida]
MNAETKNDGSGPETNASNIWQRMVKTVRDVDKQKVTDTKEDLDTLLVFAGLFSAVVTTFVVATYPSLQQDNTDELVFLMRQSLAQNYTFTDGVLRPTTPFPNDMPFEVPLWALRVNALWFASLIISLSTASFGMLVKQWLTEYVAMEQWISPEEQLRARQHRHPGLRHWKVFEIAALLPLLLHISLGLFFVGLSFYTAAANETIGRSTFTLVAGWAFFALLTLIAPLASPRCPYKITLFTSASRVGRRYVTSHFWVPGRAAINGTADASRWVWINVICLPFRLASTFMTSLRNVLDAARRISVLVWVPLYALSLPFLLVQRTMSYIRQFISFVTSDHKTDTLEEGDVVRGPFETHELLLSVDELLISDGDVLSTMAELLRQTRTDPQYITAFVLGCIRHRIAPADRDQWIPTVKKPVQGLLDLRILSASAWDVLSKLLGEILKPKMSGTSDSEVISTADSDGDSLWEMNAAAVLLSHSLLPFPAPVEKLMMEGTMLAKMLQLIRTLVVRWPLRDVLHIVWIAMTASERRPGTTATVTSLERKWTRLPARSRRESGVLTDLQVVVVQIMLENAWREHARNKDFTEAIQIIAHILGTSLPVEDLEEYGKQMSQSSTHGSNLDYASGTQPILAPKYYGIADYLEVVVGNSSELIASALKFYSAYVNRSLIPHRYEDLWAGIHRTNSKDLSSTDMKPIILDLWRFLLCCARAASKSPGGGEHLQTDEFVKLILVLARPHVPRAFGRTDPAGDWGKLVPILDRAAREQRLYRPRESFDPSAQLQSTIPALAQHALVRLRSVEKPDVPEQLVRVLERFVEKAAKPEQDDGILGRFFRRPRDTSRDVTTSRGVTLSPLVQSPRPAGSPAPASDQPASPARTNHSRHGSRAPSTSGEKNGYAYTERPRGRRNSAAGIAREKSSVHSIATPSRGRDPTPYVSSDSRAEPTRHMHNRGESPAVAVEGSHPPNHDPVQDARRNAANAVAPSSRPVPLSFSSRQSFTAASTRLSLQAPVPRPTRVLAVQVAPPASASTSTSIGSLSRAGNMNVPPLLLFPSARPLISHAPAAAASSTRTVPAITIHAASSAAGPMSATTDSSVSGSILVPPPPGEQSTSRPINLRPAAPAPRTPAVVPSAPQQLPSMRPQPAHLAGIAGTSQHTSGSTAQTPLPAIPAEIVVHGATRSESTSFQSATPHAPAPGQNYHEGRRQPVRSQSVDLDLEAGPVDVPQRAQPLRTRSSSQAPSSYSYSRAEP